MHRRRATTQKHWNAPREEEAGDLHIGSDEQYGNEYDFAGASATADERVTAVAACKVVARLSPGKKELMELNQALRYYENERGTTRRMESRRVEAFKMSEKRLDGAVIRLTRLMQKTSAVGTWSLQNSLLRSEMRVE